MASAHGVRATHAFPIQTAFRSLTGGVISSPVVADWIGVEGRRRAGFVYVTLGTNDCQDARDGLSFEELPLEIPMGYCGNTSEEENQENSQGYLVKTYSQGWRLHKTPFFSFYSETRE